MFEQTKDKVPQPYVQFSRPDLKSVSANIELTSSCWVGGVEREFLCGVRANDCWAPTQCIRVTEMAAAGQGHALKAQLAELLWAARKAAGFDKEKLVQQRSLNLVG